MSVEPRALLAIFAGGMLGSAARYGIGVLTHAPGWPWGTFIVNLSGAFVLGMFLEWLALTGPDEGRRRIVRLGFGTGLLGSYTTYSAFAVEAVGLSWAWGSLYVVASVGFGVALAAAGVACAKKVRR